MSAAVASADDNGDGPVSSPTSAVVKPVESAERTVKASKPTTETVSAPVATVAQKAAKPVAKAVAKATEQAAEPVAAPVKRAAEPVAKAATKASQPVAKVVEPVEKAPEPVEKAVDKVAEPAERTAEPVAQAVSPVLDVVVQTADPVVEMVDVVTVPPPPFMAPLAGVLGPAAVAQRDALPLLGSAAAPVFAAAASDLAKSDLVNRAGQERSSAAPLGAADAGRSPAAVAQPAEDMSRMVTRSHVTSLATTGGDVGGERSAPIAAPAGVLHGIAPAGSDTVSVLADLPLRSTGGWRAPPAPELFALPVRAFEVPVSPA